MVQPPLDQLSRRERGIADQLEKAQADRQQAELMLREYRRKLDAAEEDARRLLERSRQDATAAREKAVAEGREQSRRTLELARQEIEQARRQAQEELRIATANLAADVAGQLLQRAMNDDDRRRMLDASLEEVSRRLSAPSRQ